MKLKKLMASLLLVGATTLPMTSANAFFGGWGPWDWFDDDDYYYGPWGYPGYGYPGYYGGYPGYYGGYPGYYGGYPGYYGGYPGYYGGYPGYGGWGRPWGW